MGDAVVPVAGKTGKDGCFLSGGKCVLLLARTARKQAPTPLSLSFRKEDVDV
jgi:hypothetical protein